jgi:hypothetical protein
VHANEDFVVSNARLGNVAEDKTGACRFLHEGFQFSSKSIVLRPAAARP